MYDSKNDFALNKLNPDAIVCKSVTGVHIRLTREDFTSEEEFREWKKLSDSDYYKMVNDGRDFYDNCISLEEAWNTTGVSAEDAFFAPLLKAEMEEQRSALLQQIKGLLTETQYRRLWMYCVEHKTELEIAQIEGVGQPRVCRSLRRAKEILKEFLRTGDKTA